MIGDVVEYDSSYCCYPDGSNDQDESSCQLVEGFSKGDVFYVHGGRVHVVVGHKIFFCLKVSEKGLAGGISATQPAPSSFGGTGQRVTASQPHPGAERTP